MPTIPDGRDRIDNLRFAEDAAVQLTEATRFLDAIDQLACSALLEGGDVTDALEGVVRLSGRVHQFLDLVIVRAA